MMKTFFVFIIILFFSNIISSQNDIETLEKMYEMVQNNADRESKARDIVMSYYYDTKDKVKEKSDKLTKEEYEELNLYQKMLWSKIKMYINDFYNGSYSKYYEKNKRYLEDYRETILDKLYDKIYD